MSEERPIISYAGPGPSTRLVRDPRGQSASRRMLVAAMWSVGARIVFVCIIAALLVVLGAAGLPGLATILAAFLLILLPALAVMTAQINRRIAMAVLNYLEQAVRLNLPLPRMLYAAEQSETRRTARRLHDLRALVEDGAPLGIALSAAVPEVSERQASLVAAADRTGRLPTTLSRLVHEHRIGNRPARGGGFTGWYPIIMALVFGFVLSLVMIFIIPKYEDLLRDFGLPIPQLTRSMLEIARFWDEPWLVLGFILLLTIIVTGGAFQRIFVVRRFWPAIAPFDYIAWFMPISHGLARNRGMADACQTMADAVAGGLPLHRAAEEATGLRINLVLKERLTRWRDFLLLGMPADDAARKARLPKLVCGMIGTSRGDTTRDALGFLASYYRGKFGRLAEVLRGAAIPLLVLGFGAIVLAFVGAMYLPLLSMMDHLCETAMDFGK